MKEIKANMRLFKKIKANPTQTINNNNDDDALTVIPQNQPIELGTINYVNLSSDGRHGDISAALRIARQTQKPIFANFVEWSG